MLKHLRLWFLKNNKPFWLTVLICGAAFFTLGWFTNIRAMAHWGLLSVLGVAFLPFVVILSGVLLLFGFMLIISLPLALFGDSGDLLVPDFSGVDIGQEGFVSGYYDFLSKQQHPVFWGIPTGIIVGALALLSLTYPVIIAKETQTVDLLARYQFELQKFYTEHGHFPEPTANGFLIFADLDGGQPVRDAFGRPLIYTVDFQTEKREEVVKVSPDSEETGVLDKLKASAQALRTSLGSKLKGASYTLTSHGYDPRDDDDDMCVFGQSRMLDKLQNLLGVPLNLGSMKLQYQAVLGLRCGNENSKFNIEIN